MSGVFGRVAARAEVAEEVALLRQRVERLGSMTSAMGSQWGLHGGDSCDTLQRQLVNAGVAVCCTAVGVVGAHLIVRKTR